MKLNFLKNPLQRIATGKSLPLKQVEAIIKYGRPEQRAKVVEKLLPSTYGLALNTKTHHILITCLEYCDNMDRVKMLYNVRRKILDLSKSPVGNVFVQKLVEKLPLKQKQEVAEMFTLNCDVEEFAQLCEHPFGNHVAQKLVEIPVCIDILRPVFLPYFNRLLRSEYGVRVVAKFISSAGDGWFDVLTAQFPDIPWNREELDDMEWTEEQLAYVDVQVAELCRTNKDSMAVSALIQHILVPNEIKDAICAHLSEFAEEYLNPKEGEAPAAGKDEEGEEDFSLPDFGGGGAVTIKKADANVPRQAYCYCQLFQYGDDAQRGELWNAIKTLLPVLYTKKETVPILVAAFKFFEESREEIRNQLFLSFPEKKKLAVEEVATNPQRTLVFRVIIETEADLISPQTVAQLIKESYELCKSPTASPVLQKIALHYAGGDYGKDMYKHLKPHLEELVNHNCASYLIQSLLDTPDTGLRSSIIRDLIVLYEDRLAELAAFQCGSRVLQKLCTLLDNESISGFVDKLIAMAEKDEDVEEAEENDDDDEEKTEGQEGEKLTQKQRREQNKNKHYKVSSNAIVSYALHAQACFFVQVLLQETRSRKMDRERKLLMNELKPHVFELAVSPWSGRVVLDTMLQSGSASLAEAMKNVVFLKAEEWLGEVSDKGKQKFGGDATMKQMLKRQREQVKEGKESAVEGDGNAAPVKKKKKIFRSMKK